ncbi:hypothetical protein EOS93_28295 [Rhizobium sp. RMa-01]|uniref:hypothetical protein n=1 Tax=unclassified Rhizobium TaxID=2613769 RepID=UPI000FE05F9F|nr:MULTISPECIES: hypothetical protein [unclassified Rhizobium]RVU06820.1 hypothetical protein EOS93_28295 [Rhizobium sp. RMa-01]
MKAGFSLSVCGPDTDAGALHVSAAAARGEYRHFPVKLKKCRLFRPGKRHANKGLRHSLTYRLRIDQPSVDELTLLAYLNISLTLITPSPVPSYFHDH